MKEVWRNIVGYEGCYQVSNLGRVKGLNRKVNGMYDNKIVVKECILKPTSNRGYLSVGFNGNKKYKRYRVHRIVLSAFTGVYINSEKQVNHKNGNKSDNRLENLEWCTARENIDHALSNGFRSKDNRGSKVKVSKLKESDIPHIIAWYTTGFSQASIARGYGMSCGVICGIVNGKAWKHVKRDNTIHIESKQVEL